MHEFNYYLDLANQAIKNIDYPKEPAQLYTPIAYTMSLGGKRIRPVLTLMACEALGGDVNQAINAAIGLEMFHNFTLLHDDVMDNAEVRRGQPTVHRRWGQNTAILSGDTMLTIATQHVARVPADKSEEILRLFNETAIAIYEGQQFDMDFERRSDVTQQEYINMITLKTSVLLGCACKMGAIIANSDDETANLFYDLGTNVGIAFQLQDDMLDVWGDEATFGKEIGGDIMNNKKTLLLINALQRADEDRLNQLRRWLTDRYAMKKEKVPAVTRIFEELGLPAVINAEIDHYNNLALEALNKLKLNDEAKAAFNKLIATLVHRTK